MDSESFVYDALVGERHIRLLAVKLDEDQPDMIRCEIMVASIDYLPCEYTAISYLRGSPEKTNRVWCKGRYIEVTASAMSVLLKIASIPNQGYIWIDGLCINQNDNTEKTIQVQLMRDIYSKASRVIAWLGAGTPSTDEAMDFVVKLCDTMAELESQSKPINEYSLLGGNEEHYLLHSWAALSTLLENPWFERAWILQEMVLAEDPVFLCGSKWVLWCLVAQVVEVLYAPALAPMLLQISDGELSRLPRGMSPLMAAYRNHRLYQIPEYGLSLGTLLIDGLNLDATDSRDRMFALLGIANNVDSTNLKPDYEATTQQIFTKMAEILLLRDRLSNRILHAAGVGHKRTFSDLPSWVPDWTTQFEGSLLGTHPESPYHASENATFPAEPRYDTKQHIITFSGCLIDEIVAFAAPFPAPIWHEGLDGIKNKVSRELAWVHEIQDLWKPSVFHPSGLLYYPDVLWRTLAAEFGKDISGRPELASSVDFLDLIESWSVVVDTWTEYPPILAAGLDNKRLNGERFVSLISDAVNGRRIFMTREGYVGLGP